MRRETDEIRQLRIENGRLCNLWRAQMLHDRSMSASQRMVCLELAEKLDKSKSPPVVVVSRETLAQVLGIAERTVSAAITVGASKGHFEIRRSTGRGNANSYFPIIKTEGERDAVSSPLKEQERDAVSSPFAEEKGAIDATKGGNLRQERDAVSSPPPYGPQIYPFRSPSSARAREASAPQALKKGVGAEIRSFTFGDRGRYQRDLAQRLPGNAQRNFNLLSDLTEERLTSWCRQQRNAPERVDIAQLARELLQASTGGA
jgi:hypothetical protein